VIKGYNYKNETFIYKYILLILIKIREMQKYGGKMEIKKETLVRISRNQVFNLIEEALNIKLDREQTCLSFHGVKGILKEEK
jgi:hypothetical protein